MSKRSGVAAAGGYCNRTVLRAPLPPRTTLVTRTRKDAVLGLPATPQPGSRRQYAPDKFTPESVRTDDTIPWREVTVFYGGKRRTLRSKELRGVLWQRGAGTQLLRLLVVAPTPSQLSPNARTSSRQPGYPLVNDLDLPVALLLKPISIAGRSRSITATKSNSSASPPPTFGMTVRSIACPAFMVAAYSTLLLAAPHAYGPQRTDHYPPSPGWQKRRRRPSCLDWLHLLRQQAGEHPDRDGKVDFTFDPVRLATKLAA